MARIRYARVITTDLDSETELEKLRGEGCKIIRSEKVSAASRNGRSEWPEARRRSLGQTIHKCHERSSRLGTSATDASKPRSCGIGKLTINVSANGIGCTSQSLIGSMNVTGCHTSTLVTKKTRDRSVRVAEARSN